jgi:hypothetical protein
MRQATRRDHHPTDAVAHSGEQNSGFNIKALAVGKQILLQRKFDIFERQLYPAQNLTYPVAIRALPKSACHVCLVLLLVHAFLFLLD